MAMRMLSLAQNYEWIKEEGLDEVGAKFLHVLGRVFDELENILEHEAMRIARESAPDFADRVGILYAWLRDGRIDYEGARKMLAEQCTTYLGQGNVGVFVERLLLKKDQIPSGDGAVDLALHNVGTVLQLHWRKAFNRSGKSGTLLGSALSIDDLRREAMVWGSVLQYLVVDVLEFPTQVFAQMKKALLNRRSA